VTSQNKALTNDAPGITFARAGKAAEILRIRRHTYVIYLVGTNNPPAHCSIYHFPTSKSEPRLHSEKLVEKSVIHNILQLK